MLTADLVRAYRRQGELKLRQWRGDARERALGIGEQLLALAEQHVGTTRGELTDAFGAVAVSSRDQRVAEGLKKLVLDRCDFGLPEGRAPIEVRREVFLRAAAHRRQLEAKGTFDREGVKPEAGGGLGKSVEDIDARLYADL